MKFFFKKQNNMMDCGPTCLYMIGKFYGRSVDLEKVRRYAQLDREGADLLGLSDAAEKVGFRVLSVEIPFEVLIKEAPLPCIIHWENQHFVVVTPNSTLRKVEIADPARGVERYTAEQFCLKWLNTPDSVPGVALLLEPTPHFYNDNEIRPPGIDLSFLLKYLLEYKRYFLQLAFGLLIASCLQLIFPFLTQSIVDIGIATKDISFITIILLAQILLFAGKITADFIRNQLLLFISTRINIFILSDFWVKLMKLPLSFFDTKKTGDILQRIADHSRIQQFLTVGMLSFVFAILNLVVFSIVLSVYNIQALIVFMIGSVLYFLWVRAFLKYRKKLDFERFAIASKENAITMQMILGIQDIRINNCETEKRWEWEKAQASLFRLGFKGLSLSQYQQAGAFLINEGKNLLITFMTAKAVIAGEMTIGEMLAMQYIVGQLNSPIEQLIGFIQQAQDAKLSLDRLNEIHRLDDEEPEDKPLQKILPRQHGISFRSVSFAYAGAASNTILNEISFDILPGKLTAIVGMSGSGKTTLLKLLLKFYTEYEGEIMVGDMNLKHISPAFWRQNCSSVLQEGYIFNDTIANNITLTNLPVQHDKLLYACMIANIQPFIDGLPLGFNTKIGVEGTGISQGQKQRILIARAVYKDPKFIFLDEATNSLDANNEGRILENLSSFLTNRTTVVVAHRLSTVKNADQIIVLDAGRVVEIGTHQELVGNKGKYFELVTNQLEIGLSV